MLKKGEFSLSEAEYWWYIFVLNNVVGFGLSEMQGKFGKYFVCVTDLGVILQPFSLILMEPLTITSPLSYQKKTI